MSNLRHHKAHDPTNVGVVSSPHGPETGDGKYLFTFALVFGMIIRYFKGVFYILIYVQTTSIWTALLLAMMTPAY
jgi:hypothetical protein